MASVVAESTQQSNPLLPDVGEMVVGIFAFLVVMVALGKLLLPKIAKQLEERTQEIEGGLKRAEEAQAAANAELEKYRSEFEQARHESARLREEAREQGAQIVAEMREQAEAEARRIIATANAQIDAERQSALAQLRAEVGALAVELAGKVVGEALDDPARQSRVIDRFLEELETRTEAEVQA
jgi:F-type H+-transporting ATPase subunit b